VLVGALILSSFISLRGEDVGFDVDRLGMIELRPDADASPEERAAREDFVLDRIRRVPGVEGAAVSGAYFYKHIRALPGFAAPDGAPDPLMMTDMPVTEEFFEIAGLSLLEGRFPTRGELREGAPVVAVSRRTARGLWKESAVGQTLFERGTSRPFAVVGIVEDVNLASQEPEDSFGEVYVARRRRPGVEPVYLLRAEDPDAAVAAAAAAVSADVPGALVTRAESFDRALSNAAQNERFRAVLFGAAGGAALLLLTVGVVGLVATTVSQRVREIGIRAALGATSRRLTSATVFELMRPMAAGLAAGVIASWWLVSLVARHLYQITPHDPRVWTAVVLGLLVTSALAAWLPARRAGRVDPAVVLRVE
jgi:hypothetical protein